jgi:hypothetical protein
MKDRVDAAAARVSALRTAGLTGQLLIALWLARGVVPLMSRQLRLWEMRPNLAPFTGTVVVPAPRQPDDVEGMVRYLTGADFTLPAGRSVPLPLPNNEVQDLVSFPLLLLFFHYPRPVTDFGSRSAGRERRPAPVTATAPGGPWGSRDDVGVGVRTSGGVGRGTRLLDRERQRHGGRGSGRVVWRR